MVSGFHEIDQFNRFSPNRCAIRIRQLESESFSRSQVGKTGVGEYSTENLLASHSKKIRGELLQLSGFRGGDLIISYKRKRSTKMPKLLMVFPDVVF